MSQIHRTFRGVVNKLRFVEDNDVGFPCIVFVSGPGTFCLRFLVIM